MTGFLKRRERNKNTCSPLKNNLSKAPAIKTAGAFSSHYFRKERGNIEYPVLPYRAMAQSTFR
jgi:hypothetical protein